MRILCQSNKWSRTLALCALLLEGLIGCGAGGATAGSGTGGAGGNGGQGGNGGHGGGLQEGQCRLNADCASPATCLPPGAFPGCGPCMKVDTPCTSDMECQSGQEICEPVQCACSGESACRPGCTTAAQCGVGQACEAHRCVGRVCSKDAPCPANFECPGAEPRCARKACSSDAECDDICVTGACYDKPGTCQVPPA